MIDKNRFLILAPHTDDGELGLGGSISRLLSERKEIYYAAFSLCKRSLEPGLAPDTLEKELKAATKILGIPQQNLRLFDYDVRHFSTYRQNILEDMVVLKKELNPDVVFLPCSSDLHQDHQVIHNEGLRAFKDATIFGYELPWNNLNFQTNCFLKLSEENIQKKIEALKEYKSQSHRAYLNEAFIRGLANARGVQIGAEFAEAFEVMKVIY